jgi:anti-sigma-K factor RskA
MKRPPLKREPHTLAGAYAMDAISSADRARFERHLARCAECAQEIASLREATARLATATAQTPPPGLKERVMAAAATTRQRSPAGADVPARARSARVGGARLRTRAWLGSLAWRGRLMVAAGAVTTVAVLAAAVVFGVSNGTMRQQLSQAQASSQQVAAVLTARDATMMTKTVRGGGTVTIVMSHSMHALVFSAAGLHALPASRAYELWLIGAAGDRLVGTLPQASDHMVGPLIASGLRSGDHLALIVEPAGATSRPNPPTPPTAPMMLDLVL